ncbi:MAG: NifB/NifX family molybdenum-iron cluster-binding protein [Desulfohalobiaceae bacterium]
MQNKILIPLYGSEVAPRFDLSAEAMIIILDERSKKQEERLVVLSRASAERMCHLILTEGIKTVICGGIEEEYYQYLIWKRIQVIDAVIGPWETALEKYIKDSLSPGDIFQITQEKHSFE